MCGRGASPGSPRTKFTVVCLWDQLAHHTSQLRVYKYKVHHRTQQSCGCLKNEERNCKKLALLPGIVPVLHGGLLTHMTIATKVGVSYDDHMNDDTPEVDNFPADVTRPSPPPIFEERAWDRGYPLPWTRFSQ